MKMRVAATCVLLSLIALTTAGRVSRQTRLPTTVEINLALKDRRTVMKALACVRGLRCNLPYGNLLRQAGPDLILYRRCDPAICTPEQQEKAKEIISKIARKYPREFAQTFNSIQNKAHFGV